MARGGWGEEGHWCVSRLEGSHSQGCAPSVSEALECQFEEGSFRDHTQTRPSRTSGVGAGENTYFTNGRPSSGHPPPPRISINHS